MPEVSNAPEMQIRRVGSYGVCCILGVFVKFRKMTVSCVRSVCVRLSVRQQAITRLPLDGFSINLIFDYFFKSIEKMRISLKSDKNNGHFT
jgi:hypothetical protein